MNDMPSLLLQQLGYRATVLLTCLVGIILSIVFWRRAPRPCLFVLLATAFAAVASIFYTIAWAYIVSSRTYASGASISEKLSLLNMCMTTVVSPVPYVLLMIAAFSGRSQQGAGFPVAFPLRE